MTLSSKAVVLAFVEAFNKADVDRLVSLYAEDAVNHQMPQNAVEGRQAIREMFYREFATATVVCIPEHIFQDGEWAILEWRAPQGLRGCGFFHVIDRLIRVQRGYWDKLSFLQLHSLPMPKE